MRWQYHTRSTEYVCSLAPADVLVTIRAQCALGTPVPSAATSRPSSPSSPICALFALVRETRAHSRHSVDRLNRFLATSRSYVFPHMLELVFELTSLSAFAPPLGRTRSRFSSFLSQFLVPRECSIMVFSLHKIERFQKERDSPDPDAQGQSAKSSSTSASTPKVRALYRMTAFIDKPTVLARRRQCAQCSPRIDTTDDDRCASQLRCFVRR